MHIELPLIEIGELLDRLLEFETCKVRFECVFWSIFDRWWLVGVDKHVALLGEDDEGVR